MTPAASNIALPARVIRGDLTGLRRRLLKGLDSKEALRLDAANVLEADGAGVQLLLSFIKTAAERGGPVTVTARSAALAEAIAGHRAEEMWNQWTQRP